MKRALIISTAITLLSCNTSDNYYKLPFGGYEVDFEGGSNNRLMKNNELLINSGLVDCKYNEKYLLISVDTTYSMEPKKVISFIFHKTLLTIPLSERLHILN
ncbi:hypothetical protein [Flavobacterium sp. CAU 1735]|uniref:hypothetical protein n=1 Tax=Flavobacterium sp. CAU 1735 TaxID=3140361 RepID=UPI0032607FED